jgi:hypothetical protein
MKSEGLPNTGCHGQRLSPLENRSNLPEAIMVGRKVLPAPPLPLSQTLN